jgi:hypothetical protein
MSVGRTAQQIGIKKFTVRGKHLVLQFLQEFFGQMDDYRWMENENETEIMIVDKNALNLEAVEHKPAVATARGGLRWNKRAIDQFKAAQYPTGARKYMDLLDATIVCGCYAKHGLVAEEISDLVFGGFTFFRHVLRDRGFHELLAMEIGEETAVKTDANQELALVPVTLAFSFTESWTLTPYADVLADIKDPPVISGS